MTLTQLLIFVPAAFLVGVSPGANNLLAFVSASSAGWRRAAQGVVGRIAAWAVLVVLVSFGLDAVLRTSEATFLIVKWLGVAYLFHLAWKLWTADSAGSPKVPEAGTLMRREFLTLMGNPKAYLLLTAFLPQFVDPGGVAVTQLLMLGSLYLLIEGVASMVWIAVGAFLGATALTPLRRRIINRASGGVLALAAVLLARSERTA